MYVLSRRIESHAIIDLYYMLQQLQIWLKPEIKSDFKSVSQNTGRTQVEIFERMIDNYKETDEYKDLVRLNAKQKKRRTMIVVALIAGTMLSYLSLRISQEPIEHAGQPRWGQFGSE